MYPRRYNLILQRSPSTLVPHIRARSCQTAPFAVQVPSLIGRCRRNSGRALTSPPPPGDLAAIDAKYDAAVSTAIGALDNILVETTSDAQRAVEHLRRSGAGCATFLIAEKQQHLERAAQERVETPEGEGGGRRAARCGGVFAWDLRRVAWLCLSRAALRILLSAVGTARVQVHDVPVPGSSRGPKHLAA